MRRLVRERWQQDRIPLLLYLVTFVVMTYPFVFSMHDSFPMDDVDTHTAMWQNWWMREALTQGKDLNQSEMLFHPNGLDVTLQPRRWASFPLWTFVYSLFGDPLAFNLTLSLGVLFKAYGMYLFGMMLFRNRVSAWVAGAFFAFAAFSLRIALQQPNTGATEWLPWFMLAFVGGLSRVRSQRGLAAVLPIMVVAGICFSLNLYMNLKIGIFAMFLGGGYAVMYLIAHRLWLSTRLWQALAAFALAATALSAPLLLSTLGSDEFSNASSHKLEVGGRTAMDLQGYLKADAARPFTYLQSIASLGGERLRTVPPTLNMAHLGLVSMAFALMGVVYAIRVDRKVAIWLVLASVFFLLSLGVEIRINGELLDIYWTPYRLVSDNFFFRALRNASRLVFPFLFAYAVLIGYGLQYRLRTLRFNKRNRLLLIVSVLMLLYGTSAFPIPIRFVPKPAYLSVLEGLPAGAVIDVPLGRQPAKVYMWLQRFHQRPILEGMIARMPPDAYDYINANTVLTAFYRASHAGNLPEATKDGWRAAVAELKRDGFRYIVLHRKMRMSFGWWQNLPDWIWNGFFETPSVYEDEGVRIYDLTQWDGPFPLQGSGSTRLPNEKALNISVGDAFKLVSWSLLSSHDVHRCQTVRVISWWEVTQTDAKPYTLSVFLADADGDGQIAIANKRASYWQTNVFNRDESELVIPCATASGKYLLLFVMNESDTENALEFRYPNGEPIGDHYYLTTLTVHEQ